MEQAGVALLIVLISTLTFFGGQVIERFLTAWSAILYVLFAIVLGLALTRFAPTITANFAASGQGDLLQPLRQGVLYAGYNLAVVPGILYCARHLKSRREALTAGALGGLIAIGPAILFYSAMAAAYPGIQDAPIPINLLLQTLDAPVLTATFHVVLFGIFVKTGAALLHALNDRLAGSALERGVKLSKSARALCAFAAMLIAIGLAQGVGIIELVARGYGLLTLAFLVLFVLPFSILGARRIYREARPQRQPA